MVAVTGADPLEGYRLRLRFDDGSERVVDLSDVLWGPMAEPLRDPDYFRLVRVDPELRTVIWPNGFDLDPDVLHGDYEPVTRSESRTGRRSESMLWRHHPIGASTGYMEATRGDWPAQVAEACALSPFAAELSALSETQLGSLREYLGSRPNLPFQYLSIHGPSKERQLSEEELVAELSKLAEWADAIVMHPDTIQEPNLYRALGRKLLLENMDARKATGRTRDELAPAFDRLPEAGFCFDIAHAWSIDESMSVAMELLDAFAERLRHCHVSSLSSELRHVPLTEEAEELFRPTLQRCVDVPWILEAPPRSG